MRGPHSEAAEDNLASLVRRMPELLPRWRRATLEAIPDNEGTIEWYCSVAGFAPTPEEALRKALAHRDDPRPDTPPGKGGEEA